MLPSLLSQSQHLLFCVLMQFEISQVLGIISGFLLKLGHLGYFGIRFYILFKSSALAGSHWHHSYSRRGSANWLLPGGQKSILPLGAPLIHRVGSLLQPGGEGSLGSPAGPH